MATASERTPVNDPRSLQPPPWEQRDRYGLLDALVQTIRQVLLEPGAFFQRMPVGLGHAQPVLFAAVVAAAGAVLDWMWALALGDLPARLAPGGVLVAGGALMATGRLLLAPVLAVVMVYVRAAVFHGLLLALGGGRLGFEATLRVVAYARATRLLSVLPICGTVIGVIWELAITVIGLVRSHECPPWQAAVAVLAPAAAVLVLLGGWAVMLLGLAALQ